MIIRYSKHFLRNHSKAPKAIQQAFTKQSALLLQNPHHPSLRVKKYGLLVTYGKPASMTTGASTSKLLMTSTGWKKSKSIQRDNAMGYKAKETEHAGPKKGNGGSVRGGQDR
jgi:hypothetical protein